MQQSTGYSDHTGRLIRSGDRCSRDAGHAHCDDWLGDVVQMLDGSFWFVEDHEPRNAGVELELVHLELEVA